MPTYNNTSGHSYSTPKGLFKAGETGFETTDILDHLDGVVRVASGPMFNLLRDRHDHAFTGAGTVTVVLAAPHLVRTLLISCSVPLDMYIGSATNTPGKRLLPDKEYFLLPAGKVDTLVFGHAADGELVVEEVGPVSAEDAFDGEPVTFGGEGVTFGGQGVTW